MSYAEDPSPTTFTAPTLQEMAYYLPQYEMHGFIAQGGMGAVYLARQAALDRYVAIKVLPPTFGGEMDFAARFQIEARAMAKLQHGNIVGVFDFGTTRAGHLFLVMEYVDGSTLHDLIQTGNVSKEHALSFALQLCDALQFAHDHGIIHRDIKPNNVLINKEGRVKVADFGLARPTAAHDQEVMMGTPDYAAPEITTGAPVDHRADIFALGVVFYEMLTKTVPKKGKQPASVLSGCDPSWDEVIVKSTRVLTKDRFQNVKDIRQALSLLANRRRFNNTTNAPQQRTSQTGRLDDSEGAPMIGVMLKGMLAVMLALTALYFWSKRQPSLDQMTAESPVIPTVASQDTGTPPAKSVTDGGAPSQSSGSVRTLRDVEVANVPMGHLSKFQQAHSDVVTDVKMLPDQKRALSVSMDGSLKLWALATGEAIWTQADSVLGNDGVDLSADGKLAATASKGGVLKIRDVETGSVRYSIQCEDLGEAGSSRIGDISALKFTADAKALLFAVAPTQNGPRCWKFASDSSMVKYSGWNTFVSSIAVVPGSSDEAFITAGSRVTSNGPSTPSNTVKELLIGHVGSEQAGAAFTDIKGFPGRLVVSPDGKYLGDSEGVDVAVFDIASQQQVMRHTIGVTSYSLKFLDGGRLLLVGVADSSMRLIEVASGKEVWRGTAESHCTNRIAVSADETFAVTGGGFGTAPGTRFEKDGDYALHLWRLPAASTFPSSGPIVVPVKATLVNLETSDSELAKLKNQFEAEWQENATASPTMGREDLDNKYVTALRSRLQTARPSERDPFLTEISRVANKGAVPAAVDPAAPAALQQLMQIYIQQIGLLEQKPKDAASTLFNAQASRISELMDARSKAGDAVGAARAKMLLDEWVKTHGAKPGA